MNRRTFHYAIPWLVIFGVTALTHWASRQAVPNAGVDLSLEVQADVAAMAAKVDAVMQRRWAVEGITPATPADEMTVLRRLSLALHGTIPSLEEIRQFESDTRLDRLMHWTATLLKDPRYGNYIGERLTRSLVGAEGGQFILYRRDRLHKWLSDHVNQGASYAEVARAMISGEGVWTSEPEVNFLTAALAEGDFDYNKLAGRTVRAFLGQRIDCAQCHNHPFAHWKQTEFQGLAACYGQLRTSLVGVTDDKARFDDPKMRERLPVDPAVPFGQDYYHGDPNAPRRALADWVVHPNNQRFERAIANRLWGLMFGKPFLTDHAVDDIPDPELNSPETEVLDLLGADFRSHNCDLRRLIAVISCTKAFRSQSAAEGLDDEKIQAAAKAWAVFPLVRLRPEQLIGAMVQSWSIQTIDQNSHLFTRTYRFFRESDYVREYGDLGDNEFAERSGTIPQALLRMNGDFTDDLTKPSPFDSVGRIAQSAKSPEKCLEACYLVCLSRRPTPAEAEHFLKQLNSANTARKDDVQDIFWTLINSPEYSWNH